MNHRATLTLNSESDTALDMMASTWSTENGHLVANSKTIAVSNSSFALNNGALEAETLDIVSSNVDFNGDLNTTTINNWNSNLRLFGTVTADTVFSSNGTTFINATREVQSYTCVGKSVLDVDGWAVADILTNTEGCANSDIWTSIVNAQRTALDL